jgi:hypothetical protein
MSNKLYILLSAALLLFAACKPCDDPTNPECENYCDDPANPDCFNYDPCLGKALVSAAFEMAEVVSRPRYADSIFYVPTDTAVAENQIRFKALQEADYYEWHIGTEPRTFYTREITLYFDEPTELVVALVVKRAPDKLCFSNDDGEDTVYRRLVVMPPSKSALIGRFEGVTDQNPGERYVMEFFNYYYPQTPNLFNWVKLTGVTPGCNNLFEDVDINFGDWGYRIFISEGGALPEGNCYASKIKAWLSHGNDSLYVQFQRLDTVFPHLVTDPAVLFRGARLR